MAASKSPWGQSQNPLNISVEPRRLRASDTWFEPGLEPAFQEKVLALLLNGDLPDWPVVIPPELRISRKLGFRVEDQIVVMVGIGLVQRDRDNIVVSTTQLEERASEGVIIHDSYISRLDLKRDPLGGLSKSTVRLALRRMAAARESAGSMAIIPAVLAHGSMYHGRANKIGFLVYSYPAYVKKPAAWLANTDEFDRGMENMARFLASLHRQGFHGSLYRPGDGFANTLWTADERLIPVVTGWGQHAGLFSNEMAIRDVRDLIGAGICQIVAQDLPDKHELSLKLARRVLVTYGQMRSAFKQQEFDFQEDPIEGLHDGLEALADEGKVVKQYITRFL
jgi:hypothetical protein